MECSTASRVHLRVHASAACAAQLITLMANLRNSLAPGPSLLLRRRLRLEDVDPDDADYLSFGYWVRTTEKDGATTYGVGTLLVKMARVCYLF